MQSRVSRAVQALPPARLRGRHTWAANWLLEATPTGVGCSATRAHARQRGGEGLLVRLAGPSPQVTALNRQGTGCGSDAMARGRSLAAVPSTSVLAASEGMVLTAGESAGNPSAQAMNQSIEKGAEDYFPLLQFSARCTSEMSQNLEIGLFIALHSSWPVPSRKTRSSGRGGAVGRVLGCWLLRSARAWSAECAVASDSSDWEPCPPQEPSVLPTQRGATARRPVARWTLTSPGKPQKPGLPQRHRP